MSLESGTYEIKNAETSINRYPIEDRSLNPKRIISLPSDVKALHPWTVEKVDDKYLLKAGGAPTGQYEGHVYALLIDQEKAEHWVLDPAESPNSSCKFIISTKDRKKGWVAQEGSTHDDLKKVNMHHSSFERQIIDGLKVKCEALSGSDGNYPANEIFQFSKVTAD
ncbi:hypothetical protein PQX77_006435 [Marasmius sp. AFHP31]|nr:hypothetical protein PQX77_006435 [Marasmius sp. AFHP31]